MAKLPETTRVARILDIIWRINTAPRQWTRKRLAQEFEVSERSITSDLEIIKHRLHFELESAYGQGYYFAKIQHLPAVSYSVPEALALVLSARAAQNFPGIPQRDLKLAITRLASVIPGELRQMIDQVLGDQPENEPGRRSELLNLCAQSASRKRTIHIAYAASSTGDLTERHVDAYAVIPYERAWHMVGYCHLRQGVRTFKIDRIVEAQLTDDAFELDPAFSLDSYLNSEWGLMRGLGLPAEQVILRFSAPASSWIAEETWHASQELLVLTDGRTELRLHIVVSPEFSRWVLRFGSTVEIVEPASLRDWIANEAHAILDSIARQNAAPAGK